MIGVFRERSFDWKARNAMTEKHQTEPCVPEETKEPVNVSHPSWTLPATHRNPALVVLVVALILLQLAIAGIVIVHAQRLFDLGERIERLEKK